MLRENYQIMNEIQSVTFKDYMAFKNFSISLSHYNVFTGPNNSGKSTIIHALQILAYAHRSSRRRRPSHISEIRKQGYVVPESAIPVSIDNVHNEYREVNSIVKIKFSGGGYAVLTFPPEIGCYLHYEDRGGNNIDSLDAIKHHFDYNVGVIPFLGPVEPKETLLTREHVLRSIDTYLSPRHFRNQWHHVLRNQHNDEIDDFFLMKNLLHQTWPEMDIELPELQNLTELVMFCTENRITREIGWAGCGFQVWIQILSHLVRNKNATTIIIDEPEIYLHPDLQRKFVSISKELGPQIIIASHSVELINEADVKDILIIDKNQRSAKRLDDSRAIQKVVDILGSVQNMHLTRLLKNKKVLFLEGKDYQILKKLARKIKLNELSRGEGITIVSMGGFSEWPVVTHANLLFETILEEDISSSIILDRDYRCDDEVNKIVERLSGSVKFCHFWERKEIENYIIDTDAIKRVAENKLKRRKRTDLLTNYKDKIDNLFNAICKNYIEDIVSKSQQSLIEYKKGKKNIHQINKGCSAEIRTKMKISEEALKLIPGKAVLADLNTAMQNELGISFTYNELIKNIAIEIGC